MQHKRLQSLILFLQLPTETACCNTKGCSVWFYSYSFQQEVHGATQKAIALDFISIVPNRQCTVQEGLLHRGTQKRSAGWPCQYVKVCWQNRRKPSFGLMVFAFDDVCGRPTLLKRSCCVTPEVKCLQLLVWNILYLGCNVYYAILPEGDRCRSYCAHKLSLCWNSQRVWTLSARTVQWESTSDSSRILASLAWCEHEAKDILLVLSCCFNSWLGGHLCYPAAICLVLLTGLSPLTFLSASRNYSFL